MAKCKGCGTELLDGTVFCPYCGAQVEKDESKNVEFVDVVETSNNQYEYTDADAPKQESKAFGVFATIGMILGFVTLFFVMITLLCGSAPEDAWSVACVGFEFAIPGFVFSIIGKKSKNHRGKATFGFVANLVGMILLFILAVVFLVIAMLSDSGYTPSIGGYY
ncbi:MAG: zinc-ribbon domain-containing protein [Erysipelotrichaceae bacterium]|nr:zinc-ribbon domain-containing protein [Erysipelotrichaceae bacterium]